MEINSVEYNINIGYSSSEDPKKDTVKFLTYMDGSDVVINYGARVERISEFTIIDLDNSEFITLVEYLIANAGNKVLIKTRTSGGENIFPDVTGGGASNNEYYVYLLEPKNLSEEDFSVSRELFTLTLKVALAGTTSGAIPNEADSSAIDVLIKIDTVQADTIGGTEPTSPTIGDRWLDTAGVGDETTARMLYEYDGSNWFPMYIVMADNSTYGWKNGSFYLSTFADVTYDGDTYKAGLINKGSIKPPKKLIDIDKGPAIAKIEGFSFSWNEVYNGQLIWKWFIDNGVCLFGAVCEMWLHQSGVVTKLGKGKNTKNEFSYTDHIFKVEPFIFNDKGTFPKEVIKDEVGGRYEDVKADMIDKTVIVTYGRHSMAELQNISTTKNLVSVKRTFPIHIDTPYKETKNVVMQILFGNSTKLYIRKTAHPTLSYYSFTDEQITNFSNGLYTIQVIHDSRSATDDSNIGEVRKVISVVNPVAQNYVILTLDEALPVPSTDDGSGVNPKTTDTITCVILKALYQYQQDDQVCGSFGTFDKYDNYHRHKIKVYTLDETEKEVVSVPQTEFEDNDPDFNILKLNLRVAADASAVDTYAQLEGEGEIFVNKGSLDVPLVEGGAVGDAFDFSDSFAVPSPFSEYKRVTSLVDGSAVNDNVYCAEGIDASVGVFRQALWKARVAPIPDVNWYAMRGIFQKAGFDPTGELVENSVVVGFKFPINHSLIEKNFLNSSNARLILDLTISSATYNGDADGTVFRYAPAPFNLIIRFKKINGDYVVNDNWKKSFNEEALGLYSNNAGTLGYMRINNDPDNKDDIEGTFRKTTTTLKSATRFIVLSAKGSDASTNLLQGDLCWRTDTGALREYNGSTWANATTQPEVGDLLYERPDNLTPLVGANYKVWYVDAPGSIRTAAVTTEYDRNPVYSGRDLFDLTDDLFTENGVWAEVECMEVLITNGDLNNQWAEHVLHRHWELAIILNQNTPALYQVEELEVIDRPLFSALEGRAVGTFPTLISPIVSDIMNTIYPNKWNSASLTTLLNQKDRASWYWRKQFVEEKKSKEVLEEMLWNLWACAIFNTDDEIEFKTLDPKDVTIGASDRAFTESNILADTVKNPKLRNVYDIFQEYKLNFTYYPPARVSSALSQNKYEDTILINKSHGSSLIQKIYCRVSRRLYGLKDTNEKAVKEINFNYLYDKFPEELATAIIEHFVFDAWTLKFKIPITAIMGVNALELLDKGSINTTHFMDNATIYGFIISITPNIYAGWAEIGLFIPRPPGFEGPFCDNFNDALHISSRTVSGMGNNDAGQISARTLASYTKKDAGQISVRDFDCI